MSSDIANDADDIIADFGALLGACPLPLTDYKKVVLAYGSGGKLSHQLIGKLVMPQFAGHRCVGEQHVVRRSASTFCFPIAAYRIGAVLI